MGYQDGGADVREFRAAMLGGGVTPDKEPVAAIGNGRCEGDNRSGGQFQAGEGRRRAANEKSRDDAAAAAILAVAEGRRRAAMLEQEFSYAVL